MRRRYSLSKSNGWLRLIFQLCLSVADVSPAQEPAGPRQPCPEDAMLVFDGSGSMAGTERFGIASEVTRIDKVREALNKVLPDISPMRDIGLVTIGPGEFNKCDDARLAFPPQPDAGDRIMTEVNAIAPSGRTPLAIAVEKAAEALDYRQRPAVIVVLTDGDDTCGGAPCSAVQRLKAEARRLTIHVIGYRVKDWVGEKVYFELRCLADETGGLYITAETTDDLIAAFRKTLGCPFITDAAPSIRKHQVSEIRRQLVQALDAVAVGEKRDRCPARSVTPPQDGVECGEARHRAGMGVLVPVPLVLDKRPHAVPQRRTNAPSLREHQLALCLAQDLALH